MESMGSSVLLLVGKSETVQYKRNGILAPYNLDRYSGAQWGPGRVLEYEDLMGQMQEPGPQLAHPSDTWLDNAQWK